MKKIILILIVWFVGVHGFAQTITAAEYFIDSDPGAGNGIPIAVSPIGATVNFVASIPTSTLSSGFHFVCIRTKDNGGKWGLFETKGFYISPSNSNTSNIQAAEFFIDADPGAGNGTAISPPPNGANPVFVTSIPTTTLGGGFHFIVIRTKDASGKWGLFENKGFFISTSTSNVSNITAAEFFIDTDPGTGNGTAITPAPIGANTIFVTNIPTTSLSAGFHFIAIRTKDATGKWGMFENRGFFISSSTSNVGNIIAAEYFIDSDPGTGNGTNITPSPVGANPSFVVNVPTTSLATGFHFLAIRTKDASGKWGMFENRGFYISTQTTNVGVIVSGEYFFDNDPGVGNATAFSFITPGNTVIQTFNFATPPAIAQGVHKLALRTKNADGKWGLFEVSSDFTVTGALPLQLISFTGRKEKDIVKLQWQTENEINTHYFIVQRSANGFDFADLGNVAAFNTIGQHNYNFNDVNPLQQTGFYRLKQVDLNGTFTISNVVKINDTDRKYELRLYPNPTVNKLTIDWNGSGKNIIVKIIDSKGAMLDTKTIAGTSIITVNVTSLAKGIYYIELNDGEILKRSSFIKQ